MTVLTTFKSVFDDIVNSFNDISQSPDDISKKMDESAQPLLTMLRRLPPSKELLDFYHKKLEQFSDEEAKVKYFQINYFNR